MVKFADKSSRIAFYAMSHIADSNRFKETTLRAIRDVVQTCYDRVKDWGNVEKDFLLKFGQGKILGICLLNFLVGP